MRRFTYRWSSGVVACVACAGAVAVAQDDEESRFPVPPAALSFEDDDCTIELYSRSVLRIRTSKKEQWLLQIMPKTTVTVDGTAETSYLRRGMKIAVRGKVDRRGSKLEEPITEIELIDDKVLGFFEEGKDGQEDHRIPKPGSGEVLIKGVVVADAKDGQLTLGFAGNKISGKLDDKVVITFSSDDLTLAETGDKVSVKAWYLDNLKPIPAGAIPGKAWAEQVFVTLVKPLEGKTSGSRR